jgi:hypothetical protein
VFLHREGPESAEHADGLAGGIPPVELKPEPSDEGGSVVDLWPPHDI